MNDQSIGIFDSGIGGLTCVKEMHRLLPHENIVYFGDTARIPYGTRSRETVELYAAQDIAFIRSHHVKMIIAACGTVSSVMGARKDIDGIPFTGVVIPAVQAACAATSNGRIGIIGTPATIKSGAYGKAIRTIRPDSAVIGNPCPLFVPMAENGITSKDDPVVKAMVERYLAPIKKENVDTLILGCTHYPLLYDAVAEYMGEGVTLISSGAEAAKTALNILTANNMLSDREENGTVSCYSSDSPEMFEENAHRFIGEEFHGSVRLVAMEELLQI
jgi:glutamate racemase